MVRVEEEVQNLVTVFLWVAALMTYARWSSSKSPAGLTRLIVLLPPILVVPLLPFYFSSINLRGFSGFILGWLSVFKLLLLAFDSGPLHPSLPLLTFIFTSTMPVKLRVDPSTKPSMNPSLKPDPSKSSTAIKFVLLGVVISMFIFKDAIHPNVLMLLFFCYIYLSLEVALACTATVARAWFGLQLEPHFDAPYLSTSLQEFWGRRWNLMVTGILRPSVYNPVRARWGTAAATLATFFVSGVMHEIMTIYLDPHSIPSGQMSCFFILQGVCTVAEKHARQRFGSLLHPALAAPLVVMFVVLTGALLFYPPLQRQGIDLEILSELIAIGQFLEKKVRAIPGLQHISAYATSIATN